MNVWLFFVRADMRPLLLPILVLCMLVSTLAMPTDADLHCSACEIAAQVMHGIILHTDASKTIDVGSRLEGGFKHTRKTIPYVRSETHLQQLFEGLCTTTLLGDSYGGHAQHINTKRWHFVSENMSTAEQTRYGKKLITGKATGMFRAVVCLSHFLLMIVTLCKWISLLQLARNCASCAPIG